MELITYDLTGQEINPAELHDLIEASGSVTDFEFVTVRNEMVTIFGTSISSPTVLDNLFSNYTATDLDVYNTQQETNPEVTINETTITIGSRTTVDTGLEYNCILNTWIGAQPELIEVDIVGTIDEDNVSSIDNQLTDSNFNSLCYNNSILGTTNLKFVGADLGTAKDIEYVYIYWFSSSYDGDFKIQTSNDGTTWTDQTGVLSGEYQGSNQEPQIFTLSPAVNARYIRPFVTSGTNPYYFVINELELYVNDPNIEYKHIGTENERKIIGKNINGNYYIQNKYPYDIQVKINYI